MEKKTEKVPANDIKGNNSDKKNGISTHSSISDNINKNKDNKSIINNISSNVSNTIIQKKEAENKENKSVLGIVARMMQLKELCLEIKHSIKNFTINKGNVDKYNELKNNFYDQQLLLKKLSCSIILLQNPNLINLKRKIVECLFFSIFEKYHKEFSFDSYYFPNLSNIKDLQKIISDNLAKSDFENKTKFEGDIKRLEELIKKDKENIKNKETKDSEDNIENKETKKEGHDIHYNLINNKDKKHIQIKMVLEFIKFCKKRLNPFIHGEGDKINNYLLPRSLFASNLQYENYLLSLNDLIQKIETEEKKIKSKFNELDIDENIEIYKHNKEINVEEALFILLSKNKNNIFEFEKNNIDNIVLSRKELKYELDEFNAYFRKFTDFSLQNIEDEVFINDDIYNKESDLIEALNNYGISISKALDSEMNRTDAEVIIEKMREEIEKEINISIKFILLIDQTDGDFNSIKNELDSKINRLYLIMSFIKQQTKKFNERQKYLYQKYQQNAITLIDSYKLFENTLKQKNSEVSENLFIKWLETKPKFGDEYLKENVLINNFKELISSIKLDIKYSYDEKFVLWAVKNNFSYYLKN